MLKLTKIPHSKIKVLERCLTCYIEILRNDKGNNELMYAMLSLAEEFLETKIEPILRRKFPSKTHSISMRYHTVFMLQFAIKNRQDELLNGDYDHAILELMKIEVFKLLLK